MSLQIYENSNGQGPISKNDSFSNPIQFSISQDGAVLEQRFYLRSDDPFNEGFEDGLLYARDSTFPDEAFWVEFAPDINGAAGQYSNSMVFTVPVNQELPFWLKLDVPGGQAQGTKVDIKIIATYVQVDG